VTGEEQRHHFIAQLPVAHPAAVFIARGQQHRKQVAFVFPAGASFADNTIDDVVRSFSRWRESEN